MFLVAGRRIQLRHLHDPVPAACLRLRSKSEPRFETRVVDAPSEGDCGLRFQAWTRLGLFRRIDGVR
jgi:hypothetical protein